MTPGAIYIPHEDWAGGDKEFQRLKRELAEMYRGVNSGKPMIAEGGGKIERGFTLEDLQLGELWREVEAVICGVFGVPASLVGTIIGLENSPWSHLKTAKESFYDETVIPEWEMLEEPITKSLIREFDDDVTHIARFDRSRITALQADQSIQATIAATVARFTSVNERRTMVGLKRRTEPEADDIPELAAPVAPPKPPADGDDDDEADRTSAADKASRRRLRFSSKAWKRFASLRVAYVADLADAFSGEVERAAAVQLERDASRIADIVSRRGRKADDGDALDRREVARMMLAIETYLDGESGDSWAKATTPLFMRVAEAGIAATVAVDLGLNVQLLRPHLEDWIRREAAFLITNVSDTTKDDVRKALADSLDAGEGIGGTVKRIREMTTFNRARATLIGRTETTRTLTGAPLESLQNYADATGQEFTKTWLATDDSRVRPEHWEMNGETVAISAVFSNGLAHPGEPNCRCGLTYGVEGVEP
jgi:SPP1 gp7 family putative phage head morphogenesis protein